MFAKLVFIHCEKSAGTSQRALFIENYGRENIFWDGLDDQGPLGAAEAMRERRLVRGGHLSYAQFRGHPERILYASVVRDPVSRAVSLFHYFCENAPEDQRRYWAGKGLQRDSMLRSLESVPVFRKQIANTQCLRLSGERDFAATKLVMATENVIIGCFDDLDAFNHRLATLLNWRTRTLGHHNTAKRPSYQREILAEPGLQEAILELNREDNALYQYVAERKVVEHLPDRQLLIDFLAGTCAADGPELCGDDVRGLKLVPCAGAESVELQLGAQAQVPVQLLNQSQRPLSAADEKRVMIATHWYALDGELLQWEGARTALPRHLFPGESVQVAVRIVPPPTLGEGRYRVRVALLQLGVQWLERLDAGHVAELRVRLRGPR